MWFRRFSAIVSISLGSAFVFLPFPTNLAGERNERVVRFTAKAPPFTDASAREQFGHRFVQFKYEELEPFPDLLDAILGFMSGSGARCVAAVQWRAFFGNRDLDPMESVVYAFQDELHRIDGITAESDGPDGPLVCFDCELLGAYDNREWGPLTWLDNSDLKDFPAVEATVRKMADGEIPAECDTTVSLREWRRFQRSMLEDSAFRPSFVASGLLFNGFIAEAARPWSLAMPWLRDAARVVGCGLAMGGLILLIGCYRQSAARPGIAIAPVWLALFCDVISVAASIFFTALALDALWVGPLAQASLLGLEPEWSGSTPITGLHFISIPAVAVALPLLTLWFTSLTGQRILIDDEGITSFGALGSSSISWADITVFSVREQNNPFAFTVVDFRKLQRVVDVESEDRCLTINEPSEGRKARIIASLRGHVPADKKSLLKPLEEAW